MTKRFTPGEAVHTPFGKGLVREVQNHGRLLVDVKGCALVLQDHVVFVLEGGRPRSHPRAAANTSGPAYFSAVSRSGATPAEVDLHGLTVTEALTKAEEALNDALLADLEELRLIHGRSGGRLRAALHRRLGEITSVRAFHIDPANEGITIARL